MAAINDDRVSHEDKYTPVCNLGKPIGDERIAQWKDIMIRKLKEAVIKELEYRTAYSSNCPLDDVLDYTYEDLIPGTDAIRNRNALHLFYSPGYQFFFPLMMWYLEKGMVQQYLNAARSIYYCDRDCPDFYTIIKRAAEIAVDENLVMMFPIALYQYFNWSTFDGVAPVRVKLPGHPILSKIKNLITANIEQNPDRPGFFISHLFIADNINDEDYKYDEEAHDKFNSELVSIMANNWPEVVVIL